MSRWSMCLLVALAAVSLPAPASADPSDLERPLPLPTPAPAADSAAVAAAAFDPAPYLVCTTCGRFNSLVSALLLAVYNLLLALLGTVNSALCYTLHLVYILLCIIQVTVSNEIAVAVSGLILILQRVALLPVVGGLLQTIGLLLTGLLGCLLRILGVALIL